MNDFASDIRPSPPPGKGADSNNSSNANTTFGGNFDYINALKQNKPPIKSASGSNQNLMDVIHNLWRSFISGNLDEFNHHMDNLIFLGNTTKINLVFNTMQSDLRKVGIASISINSISGIPFLQMHRMINEKSVSTTGTTGIRQSLRFRPGGKEPEVSIAYFEFGKRNPYPSATQAAALLRVSCGTFELFTALSQTANQHLARKNKT